VGLKKIAEPKEGEVSGYVKFEFLGVRAYSCGGCGSLPAGGSVAATVHCGCRSLLRSCCLWEGHCLLPSVTAQLKLSRDLQAPSQLR